MSSSHLLVSSVTSGFLVGAICTPFDVVKNYWQAHPKLKQRTDVRAMTVVRAIYSQRGLRPFWTGVVPSVSIMSCSNFLFFSLYERLKQRYSPSVAAVQARTIAVTLLAPLEFVRTKMQSTIGQEGGLALLRRTLETESMGSLWRGTGPTLLRDIPFSAVYWQLYETAKRLIAKHDPAFDQRPQLVRAFAYPFCFGALSASVATVVTHPFDVLKTTSQSSERFRVDSRGFRHKRSLSTWAIGRELHAAHGWRAFCVGLGPRLAKIVPSCAVMLGTYELTRHLLDPALGSLADAA